MGFTTTRNNDTAENTNEIPKLVTAAIRSDIAAYRNKLHFILDLLRAVEDNFDDKYIVFVSTDNDINVSEISVRDILPKALYGSTRLHPFLMHRLTNQSVRLPSVTIESGDAYWERTGLRVEEAVAENLVDALHQFTKHDLFSGIAAFMEHCDNDHVLLLKVQQETFGNPTTYHDKLVDLGLIAPKTPSKPDSIIEVRD